MKKSAISSISIHMISFISFFSKTNDILPQDARAKILGEDAKNIQVVDVRQPKEYSRGHIPGAILIPLAQLEQRAGELDPQKTTIVY